MSTPGVVLAALAAVAVGYCERANRLGFMSLTPGLRAKVLTALLSVTDGFAGAVTAWVWPALGGRVGWAPSLDHPLVGLLIGMSPGLFRYLTLDVRRRRQRPDELPVGEMSTPHESLTAVRRWLEKLLSDEIAHACARMCEELAAFCVADLRCSPRQVAHQMAQILEQSVHVSDPVKTVALGKIAGALEQGTRVDQMTRLLQLCHLYHLRGIPRDFRNSRADTLARRRQYERKLFPRPSLRYRVVARLAGKPRHRRKS